MKLLWLNIRRVARYLFRHTGYYISVAFLLVSISISLMLLVPQFFHRVPVYSYFVTELSLPISYTLTGTISVLDENNHSSAQDIEIHIGGYSSVVELDGAFSLKFTAANVTEVPVVIMYTSHDGQFVTQIESIELKEGVYSMQREFLFYA